MSFTHYFERTRVELDPEIFERIGHDLAVVIAASPVAVCGAYGEAGTAPTLTSELIAFNGVGPDGYESFFMQRDPAQPRSFCSTGGISGEPKPYDLLVMAALIVAHNIAPDAWRISSDGWDFQWTEALALVNRHLPGGYELPPPVTANAGLDTEHYADAHRAWLRQRNRAA